MKIGLEILNNSDKKDKVIKWIMENPYPKDDAIKKFVDTISIDVKTFNVIVKEVLCSFLNEGKSKGKDYGGHNKTQVKMGIEVEMEHTTNPLIAEKIALDHLTEFPDYYTRLAKMEKEAKNEEK
jgi:hypothetical protein